MATALHFLPYYFVHGKSMIYLGLICAINVFVGYIFADIPLEVIAYIDSAIKLVFGIYLLFFFKAVKKDTLKTRCLHITTTANYNNRSTIILLFKRLLKPVVYLASYTTTIFSSKHYKPFIHFLLNSYIINWRRYLNLRFDNLAILFYNSIYYWHSLSFLFRGP